MKLNFLFLALFCAAAPVPCRAIVHPLPAPAVFFEKKPISERAAPIFFEKKGSGRFSKMAAAARFLGKTQFFGPKKGRKNGIDRSLEPKDGLKSVLLGLAGCTLLSLAFPGAPISYLLAAVGIVLLCIGFGLSNRARRSGRPSDRVPGIMGLIFGLPGVVAMGAMTLLMLMSLLFTIWSVPVAALLLVFGF